MILSTKDKEARSSQAFFIKAAKGDPEGQKPE
jgi:hypothetical protein